MRIHHVLTLIACWGLMPWPSTSAPVERANAVPGEAQAIRAKVSERLVRYDTVLERAQARAEAMRHLPVWERVSDFEQALADIRHWLEQGDLARAYDAACYRIPQQARDIERIIIEAVPTWTGSQGGDFSDARHWLWGWVPGVDNQAEFNLPFQYTVTCTRNIKMLRAWLKHSDAHVTWNLGNHTCELPTPPPGPYTSALTIEDGALTVKNGNLVVHSLTLRRRRMVVSGTNTYVTISAGYPRNFIGGDRVNPPGELRVEHGATLTANGLRLGNMSGSHGVLVVNGKGSTLIVTHSLHLSRRGAASEIRVEDGGHFQMDGSRFSLAHTRSGSLLKIIFAGGTMEFANDVDWRAAPDKEKHTEMDIVVDYALQTGQHDAALRVNGAITLGSNVILDVSPVPGFTAESCGETFSLVQAADWRGRFRNDRGEAITNGMRLAAGGYTFVAEYKEDSGFTLTTEKGAGLNIQQTKRTGGIDLRRERTRTLAERVPWERAQAPR